MSRGEDTIFIVFSTPVGIKRNIFASAKLFWYKEISDMVAR
jgi:hypothetical protein